MSKYKPRPRCGADKDDGTTCRNGAGKGTDHPGVGRCENHGGCTPTHQAHAERVMAEQAAQRLGLDMTEISGGEALIREVRRSAAMVDWYAARVAELPPDDLSWGVAGRRIVPAATPDGQPVVQVEQRARVHPLVIMLRDERLLLARVAEAAHRCGIEDRLMREIEVQGALMAKVINAILFDPELEMRPEQVAKFASVVPRHLRAMDGIAA